MMIANIRGADGTVLGQHAVDPTAPGGITKQLADVAAKHASAHPMRHQPRAMRRLGDSDPATVASTEITPSDAQRDAAIKGLNNFIGILQQFPGQMDVVVSVNDSGGVDSTNNLVVLTATTLADARTAGQIANNSVSFIGTGGITPAAFVLQQPTQAVGQRILNHQGSQLQPGTLGTVQQVIDQARSMFNSIAGLHADKPGMSKGAKIAIGVGVVAALGTAGFLIWRHHAAK